MYTKRYSIMRQPAMHALLTSMELMMKFFTKILIAAITVAMPSFAFAGNSQGLVTLPFVMNSGQGYFFFAAGTSTNKPACSTSGLNWAVDLSTPAGRGIQALVLSAYAMGKTVTVTGTGTCTYWGDRENVSTVYIN